MLKQVMTEPDWWATPAPGMSVAIGNYVVDPASGMKWSDAAIDMAGLSFLYSCYSQKGSTGYILGLGPSLATLACICGVISLFTCCPRSYMSSLARMLSLMAFALIMIGFWIVSMQATNEFFSKYILCQGSPSTLTNGKGIYFDSTPCIDVKTDGTPNMS